MNIKECLEKMTSEEQESLCKKLNVETINEAGALMLSTINEKIIYLTDEEINLLANFDGTINDYLIDNSLILKVNGKYLVSKEAKTMAANLIYNFNLSIKRKTLVILFYVMANGKISLKDVMRLCRKTGVSISLKELMDIVADAKIYCEDNILHHNVNYLSKDLVTNEYKVFDIHKLSMMYELINNYYPKMVEKLISPYIPKCFKENKDNFYFELCVNAMNGDLSLEFYEAIFKEMKIKLPKKVKNEFLNLITEANEYLPNFVYGGNPLILQKAKMTDEEYYNHICKLINSNIVSDDLSEYVFAYVCINGVIAIDKLQTILSKYNNIDVSKYEIERVAKFSGIVYSNGILKLLDIDIDVSSLLAAKEVYKNYKIIDNPSEVLKEYSHNHELIGNIIESYNLDPQVASSFAMNVVLGSLDLKFLTKYLNSRNMDYTKVEITKLYLELKEIADNTPCWIYNGFTPNENAKNKKSF